jgi:hypothetical protein
MTLADGFRLADLRTLTKGELIGLWTSTLGTPPTFTASREFLLNELAWKIQERASGGLKPSVRQRLEAFARALERGAIPRELDPVSRLRPGITLIKEWRGRKHAVAVLERGFAYQGKTYQSLSQIARAITGTRWNGPVFFGLRKGSGRQAEVISDGE